MRPSRPYVRGQSGVCLILGSYYAVGLDARGIELRLAHRRRFGTDQFHPLCGLADGARALARRRGGAILPGMDADRHCRRRRAGRPVPRRQRAGAVSRRTQCRPASGVADVRAVCFRLSVRLRRIAAGGAARGRGRRADTLCRAALPRQPALPGSRPVSPSTWRSMSPIPRQLALALDTRKATRARIFSPDPATRAR